SAEAPLLRTTLLATLVDAVKVNLARGAQDIAVFELGRAYRATGVGEVPRSLDGAITADDVVALDAALGEQPRRVAGVFAGAREVVGWNGPARAWDWADALAGALRVAEVAGVALEVSDEAHMPWHPGRCATLRTASGEFVGHAGELHPKVLETLGLPARTVAFELVLDPLVAASEVDRKSGV